MVVTLTEKAAEEIKKSIVEWNVAPNTAFRIAITGGGCSGFGYQLNFITEVDEEKYIVSEQHGVKVVVDRKSANHLEGTSIDWGRDENSLDTGFKISNPNAVKSCGCGKSFSV